MNTLIKLAKAANGTLYFSTTQDGTHLHFQRKPYAAVFYAMGLLEFSRTIQHLPGDHPQKKQLDANQIESEAELYFDIGILILRLIDMR